MIKSGIYLIENVKNGKIYIGCSKNIVSRKSGHFRDLKNNRHHNPILQRSFNNNSEDCFEFKVLIRCSESDLLFWEQHFIDKYVPEYNILKNADRPTDFYFSDERKAKLSELKTGVVFSEDHRKNISNSLKEYYKHNNVNKGAFVKGNVSTFKGKCHSNESKKKISKANKGKSSNRKIPICQYNGNTLVRRWGSISEAARELNISLSLISRVKNTRFKAKKFLWKTFDN